MKKLVLLVILAFSLVLSPLTSMATTPKLINYQGKLKNLPAQSGPFLVVFEIFEDAAGGTALWIEQKNVTPSTDGTFSTYLGETNPIDLKFDKQYYVQITVGNNQPFPRTKLTSAPSAFFAADADTATYAFESGLAMDVAPEAIGLDNLAPEVLTAGGDLMGMYPNPQIRPDAILDNIPDGSITTEMLSPNISTSPSGPAGGDMTGTYPDPLIAVGAVKTDRIADGAVTNEKIADMTIMDAKIISLDAAKLFNLGALAGTVAVMTDATIDGDGTNAMPLGLADDAVTSAKILDGEVMTADLMDDAVTNEKLADDAVMSANIVDGQVMNADLAVDAVMSTNIMDGQVMTADLMDDAVTNAKLAVDAVRMENIDVNGGVPTDGEFLSWDDVDGEMRWVEPTVVTSAPLTGNGQTATPVTLDPTFGNENELLMRNATGWEAGLIDSDNIAENAITPFQLADDAVMTNHIMDGQVMTADLMDGAVNSAKILDESIMTIDLMDASVTGVKIADDAIMTNHIVDGQVMTADLMDLGVTTIKVADMAITNAKLADNSVTTLKIADGEVMTADIADVNVTEAKLADNAVSTRTIVDLAVTNGKLADNSVSTRTIQDLSVTEAKLVDEAVSTRTLRDNAVTTPKIIDLAVTNEKVGSGGQAAGKILKADGAGGVTWEDDEGIILPWTGTYDGPGDAFILNHSGTLGDGSAAVFNSFNASNADPAVEIIKDVDAGAGAALAVRGIGVQGANYIATFTNNNLNEGRTVLMENDAPTQQPLVDPGTPGDLTDDYVNPDPTGTDVEDATLVLRNSDGAASGQKLALKTYGSIQANSAIQGTDLIAHNGEIIVNNTGLAGGTLFLTEDAMEKVSDPLAVTEDFQMFNTGGDFDLNLDGHLDVRNQARIGDLVDENQVTVDGALTAVAIDMSNAGVPNVSPAGPGTATTVPTANADLLVNGDAELTGSLNLGGSADTYNSVNDIYISTDLTTLTPALPAPPTTVIFESNDAQLISARAVEDALLSHDLQVAYNNGNSITSTDAQGDIDFNLEEATDFTITGANVGNDVIIDGAGYLDAQVNIINTSVGNAVIVEDDLEPDADDTYNLGSDVNRWSNAYVNGGSVHVGPSAGQFNGTELAIGYAANAATLTVDNTLMANFNALTDMITFDPDGASVLPGQDELTINDFSDVVMINADGAGGQEVIVDGANDVFSVDADGDTFNEINVAAAGVTIDGNSDNANNVTITGSAFNVDADGDTFNEINVAAAGVTIDGNSDGNANVTVTGAAFNVNTNGLAGNEIAADGTNVTLDPTGDGANYTFGEAGVTISTTQATGDVVLSDNGINAAAAQEFQLTATGGNLDVLVDGKINVEAAASTIGDALNATQLTVEGLATATTTSAAGLVTASPAAANTEVIVQGDVQVDGSFRLGGHPVDNIFVQGDLVGNLFPAPGAVDAQSNDGELVTALAVQTALLNHDLQVAYNNGNVITTNGNGSIDFNLTGAENFEVNTLGTNKVLIDGAGILDAQVNIENTATNLVTVDDNFNVTGNADVDLNLNVDGHIENTTALSPVLVDDAEGLQVNSGIFNATMGGNTMGQAVPVDATNQLTIAGVPTSTETNDNAVPATAGQVNASPADGNSELTVSGDAQVNGSFTLGTGGTENSVDDIFISTDLAGGLFPAPVAANSASNDGQLVTALAVQQALLNHDLQVAYNNGNVINAVLAEGDIDFNFDGVDFTLTGANAGDDVIIDGAGVIDARVNIVNATSPAAPVVLDDNFDVRGNIYNNDAVNDGTPVTITDDVTMTMQDGNDNVEITSASTNGNLLAITKTAGDVAPAVNVSTNNSGINVENPTNSANAVAFSTSLDGGSARGVNVVMNGTTAAIGVASVADDVTGVAVQAQSANGVAVNALSTDGRAITASNDNAVTSTPTISVSNANTDPNAYAVAVGNGHTRVSVDANGAVQSILANGATITMTSSTIKRCTTNGNPRNNLILGPGSEEGQVIIVTNEDAGNMTITTNTLASYTIPATQATQFVWAGGTWIALNN